MSTTQQPTPPVERTIHGRLTGVEIRNAGWHRFSILEPGNQYPYRADTKRKELIDSATSLMNQDVSVQVREEQSTNRNEHTGEFFINKYLNAIAAQSGAQQQPEEQQWPPTGPQPVQEKNVVQPGVSGLEKDLTIWRQTAAKVVCCSWQALPAEQQNMAGMIEAAEAWVHYFKEGPGRWGIAPGVSMFDGVVAQVMQARPEEQSEEEFIRSLGEEVDPKACPDCGFVGTHALGCPQADFAA